MESKIAITAGIIALVWAVQIFLGPKKRSKMFMDIFNSSLGYYAIQYLESKNGSRHRKDPIHKMISGHLEVLLLPCMDSNYAYLIVDSDQKSAIVVDPSEPSVVTEVLKARSLKLIAILNTHKHWDHTSGNARLAEQYPEVEVYGNKIDFPVSMNSYTRISHTIQDGDKLTLGRCCIEVIETPGHTKGSVMFLLNVNESQHLAGTLCSIVGRDVSTIAAADDWQCSSPWLFTGDTIFLSGWGKLFEGNAVDMFNVIHKLSSKIHDSTYIFPGHEYTLTNLKFLKYLGFSSSSVEIALTRALDCEKSRLPTVPGKWEFEKSTNPYLMVLQKVKASFWDPVYEKSLQDGSWQVLHSELRKLANASEIELDQMTMLAVIRKYKDDFKPNKPIQ